MHFLSENYISGNFQIRHKREEKIKAEKKVGQEFMPARVVERINKAFTAISGGGNTGN